MSNVVTSEIKKSSIVIKKPLKTGSMLDKSVYKRTKCKHCGAESQLGFCRYCGSIV